MLPNMLLRSFKKKRNGNNCDNPSSQDHEEMELGNWDSIGAKQAKFHQPSQSSHKRLGGLRRSVAAKVSNLSHLIVHRVKDTCLHGTAGDDQPYYKDEGDLEFNICSNWNLEMSSENEDDPILRKTKGKMEILLFQVFDAISTMKKAYGSLQEAHCPWDPEKLRFADAAVVAEIQRLGILRERFRRSVGGRENMIVREIVAPYEAAMEMLRREVKAKHEEVENLREKLKTATYFHGKSKGRSNKRRVSCTTQVAATPGCELFEATMNTVKEASKCFTSQLLSLMRLACWDIGAVARSIDSNMSTDFSMVGLGATHHAKYALESYVNNKIFQGFNHEEYFGMDARLSSIFRGDQNRTRVDRFAQYRDMKAMDTFQLLHILPTCGFGRFCIEKYLSMVHPRMEESLFGDLKQRQQLLDGRHPRNKFYGQFLELCKAVWLLHLLAFSLDPPPSHFEATRGAEFHSQYMESVVRISGAGGGAKVGIALVVGFLVTPGFKLANGSIIKARVYLTPEKIN